MQLDEAEARRALETLSDFKWPSDSPLGEQLDGTYRIRVGAGNLNQVSQDLVLIDREVRRAALWISEHKLALSASDPYQNQIQQVGPGSIWIDIAATVGGELRDVLMSQPVQLFSTAHTLISVVRPSRRRQVDADAPALPPTERVPFTPDHAELVKQLVAQDPRRPVRMELRPDAVVIEVGPRRRWWSRS